MSFDAAWLALREPADRSARAAAGAAAAMAALAGRERPLIVDLGCGSGAGLRALAALAPADARWRLVDADAELLALAADAAGALGARAETTLLDLAAEPETAVKEADLVSASAFFDLVSEAWIDRLVTATPPEAAVYAALSYDGVERWTPPHADDEALLEAFHRHQGGDKGFGPAAGPRGWRALAERLRRDGRRVEIWPSPWRLTRPEHGALIDRLQRESAAAAAEAGFASAAWAAAARTACEIGHVDVVGWPRDARR